MMPIFVLYQLTVLERNFVQILLFIIWKVGLMVKLKINTGLDWLKGSKRSILAIRLISAELIKKMMNNE